MKIDNATVSSIYNYTTVIQWICNFLVHNIIYLINISNAL